MVQIETLNQEKLTKYINLLEKRFAETGVLSPIGGKEHLGLTLNMIEQRLGTDLPEKYHLEKSLTNDDLVTQQLRIHMQTLDVALQQRWVENKEQKINALLDVIVAIINMIDYIEETT